MGLLPWLWVWPKFRNYHGTKTGACTICPWICRALALMLNLHAAEFELNLRGCISGLRARTVRAHRGRWPSTAARPAACARSG